MKLLIVDDELKIRNGLKSAVDWAAIGIHQVFTAQNGVAALDICKKESPEIIITDIKMPGISGIELAEQVSQNYNVSKIILLSGYSEFEYAKAAIKIGVVDYLLKPVKISELTKLVASTIVLVEKEALQQKRNKHKLLTEILSGKFPSTKQLREGLSALDIEPGEEIVLGVIEEDILYQNYNTVQKTSLEARMPFAKTFFNTEAFSVLETPEELIFIFYLERSLRSSYKHILTKQILSLNSEYSKKFGLTVSGGMSSLGNTLDIPKLYKQSLNALDTRLYKGSKQAAFYQHSHKKQRLQPLLNIDEKALAKQISLFQTEKVLDSIDQQFELLAENRCTSHKIAIELIAGIKNILFSVISDKGIDITKIIENNESLFDMKIDFTTLDSYSSWLKDLCQLMMMGLGDMDKKRYSSEMIKVVEYINQNYSKDISLDIVAQQANKSSNYFSYIFKREMQVNFSEYLNQTRIEHAKALLASTNDLVYQIAQKVGFKDYAYFTKVFKKNCGMSPKEYRESM